MLLLKKYIPNLIDHTRSEKGYTLVEMLFVCAIVVIISMMGMGSYKSQRRYGIELRCVSRMKEIAQLEESFRDIGDPSLNVDGSYGSFFELQNAGLIAKSYVSEDIESHEVQAFIPYYKIDIVKSPTDQTLEPDRNQYMVIASPIGSGLHLKIFMMQEDGEVYFLTGNTIGDRKVWQ